LYLWNLAKYQRLLEALNGSFFIPSLQFVFCKCAQDLNIDISGLFPAPRQLEERQRGEDESKREAQPPKNGGDQPRNDLVLPAMRLTPQTRKGAAKCDNDKTDYIGITDEAERFVLPAAFLTGRNLPFRYRRSLVSGFQLQV
jgi:hypothetical protein